MMAKLNGDVKRLLRAIEEMESPLILHHYDADGISAAVIVEEGLKAMGKEPRMEMVEGLSNEDIEEYKDEELVLVDIGSHTEEINEVKKAVIIDHHQMGRIEKPIVNPWLYGLDGTQEASSSTMAWLVFRKKPELALVGAAGDIQMPFTGLNRVVLEESKAYEVVEDLLIYGRSRPLTQFLMGIYEPYIKGISQNPSGIKKLLKQLGIPLKVKGKERSYEELSEEEKIKLRSAIVKLLAAQGQVEEIEELFGEVYLIKEELNPPKRDVREFATLLNACGRYGWGDVARGIAKGEPAAIKRGERLLEKHKQAMKKALNYARGVAEDRGPYLLIDGRGRIDASIIGIVCSAMERTEGKTVIGLAQRKDSIKISMRTPLDTINVGACMADIAEKLGGEGGGHVKAGGAEIPESRIDEFLKLLDGRLMKKAKVL